MSTTLWIQLLGVIFGTVMVYFTFVRYKRKEIKPYEFWIWEIMWIILIAISLVPSTLDPIIVPLKFHRRLDFFTVIGFFVLLSLGFHNYSIMKSLESKIEVIVRGKAISDYENKNEEKRETK